MISEKKAVLRLESNEAHDRAELQRQTVNVQQNLNRFSDIRAVNSIESDLRQDDLERRGDLMLLYTLALTFISTGTAKGLIDALRATFSGSRDSSLKATLEINNRKFEITADHLNKDQVNDLIRLIDSEIES